MWKKELHWLQAEEDGEREGEGEKEKTGNAVCRQTAYLALPSARLNGLSIEWTWNTDASADTSAHQCIDIASGYNSRFQTKLPFDAAM